MLLPFAAKRSRSNLRKFLYRLYPALRVFHFSPLPPKNFHLILSLPTFLVKKNLDYFPKKIFPKSRKAAPGAGRGRALALPSFVKGRKKLSGGKSNRRPPYRLRSSRQEAIVIVGPAFDTALTVSKDSGRIQNVRKDKKPAPLGEWKLPAGEKPWLPEGMRFEIRHSSSGGRNQRLRKTRRIAHRVGRLFGTLPAVSIRPRPSAVPRVGNSDGRIRASSTD